MQKHNQKGNEFEEMVAAYYQSQGFTPYGPRDATKRHPCDFLFLRNGGEKAFWMDAKGYSSIERDGWLMTGINLRHYNEYLTISDMRSHPLWLIFGDHIQGKAYGQRFDKLKQYRPAANVVGKERHFPWILDTRSNGTKMMWPIERMEVLFDLTAEQRKRLALLTKEPRQEQIGLLETGDVNELESGRRDNRRSDTPTVSPSRDLPAPSSSYAP